MVGPPAVPLPFLLPPPPTTTADPPPGAVEFKTFGDRFQEYRDAHPEATENDLEDAAHRFADEIECEEQDFYELQTRLGGLDVEPEAKSEPEEEIPDPHQVPPVTHDRVPWYYGDNRMGGGGRRWRSPMDDEPDTAGVDQEETPSWFPPH